MTELELHQDVSNLSVQMDFARAVSTGAMLPDAYRGKPADILLAVGLGQSMGLSPAESLYRIAVIKGKPTASAELIAAQVRKAGHKLRVKGDDTTCTATIIRADDPDFPFEVTRDIAWARGMGLADNANYKKQPGTMLQWRAITAVARLACPEALYGVQYTPDEIETSWDGPAPRSGGLSAALAPETVTAEQVTDEDAPEPAESPLLNTSSALAKAMYAAIKEHGVPEDERIVWLGNVIGREIGSSKEMTDAEARDVLAWIDANPAGFTPAEAAS